MKICFWINSRYIQADEFSCIQWNYFFKLLHWSESYANFKQNSVTVIRQKYHVMAVYFLSQLQRWMGMIRSAREWTGVCNSVYFRLCIDLMHILSPSYNRGMLNVWISADQQTYHVLVMWDGIPIRWMTSIRLQLQPPLFYTIMTTFY